MFIVRDIMFCKPGKVRPMVEKFVALSKLSQKLGFGTMRVMTDVSAERYWTVISEMEAESLQQHAEMSQKSMQMPEFQDVMKGYHELIDHGRREISTREVDRSSNTLLSSDCRRLRRRLRRPVGEPTCADDRPARSPRGTYFHPSHRTTTHPVHRSAPRSPSHA